MFFFFIYFIFVWVQVHQGHSTDVEPEVNFWKFVLSWCFENPGLSPSAPTVGLCLHQATLPAHFLIL